MNRTSRTLTVAALLSLAAAGLGGLAAAGQRQDRCSTDALLAEHLGFLVEATDRLQGAGPGASPADALVDRLYARAIREADRLTAAGARPPEPWPTAQFAFARSVDSVVAARGLDPELGGAFLAAARRLAGD